jgi:glycosyltransferase involved in cell wall biosynthesis
MDKDTKLISVIMSAYNCEDTISESIDSIVNQTYKNIELLIVDDSSSDRTYEILKKYENEYSFIKVFKNDINIGLTKSLNKLIKNSKGEFIARQDADDISFKNRLESQLFFLKENNLDACTTRAVTTPENRVIPSLSYFLPLRLVIRYKNPFIHGSLLIRKKIMIEINCYDEAFYYAQDYKLMKELIINKYKIKIMKSALYNLNTENNISTTFSKDQKYYADCVRKNKNPKAIGI